MIRNLLLLVLLFVFSGSTAKHHTDSKGAEIHTPFRWVVADSTARVALTVTARDTQKLCFQIADTTIWMLSNNSPKRWAWVSGKKADSLWMRTFQAVTAGITRINTDSSDHRVITADSATIPVLRGNVTFRGTVTGQDVIYDSTDSRIITADSATIPVFKGTKTYRDSTYFDGGLRGLRLYMQRGSIDTLYSNIMGLGTTTPQHRLHVNGNIRATAGNIGISNSVTSPTGEWYFYVGSDKSIELKDNISNTFPITIDSGAGNYGIRIVRGGLIGVNTSTPDSTLTVGGSAHVTGNARIDGSLKVQSCSTTTGITLGAGDLLSVYDTGSFACSLFDGGSYRAVVTAKYTVIGNVVVLKIPSARGTISATSETYIGSIPSSLRPASNTLIGITSISNNDVVEHGSVIWTGTGTKFILKNYASTYLNAGNGGLYYNYDGTAYHSFTYTLD